MIRKFVALVLVGVSVEVLAADNAFQPHKFDWPQWQGPDRTAISHETGLLKKWPAAGPKLAWRAEKIGGGYSAPSGAAGGGVGGGRCCGGAGGWGGAGAGGEGGWGRG